MYESFHVVFFLLRCCAKVIPLLYSGRLVEPTNTISMPKTPFSGDTQGVCLQYPSISLQMTDDASLSICLVITLSACSAILKHRSSAYGITPHTDGVPPDSLRCVD